MNTDVVVVKNSDETKKGTGAVNDQYSRPMTESFGDQTVVQMGIYQALKILIAL